ncbi:hypothetical protein TWF730_006866 [Orbilia blumenaviensis]|uniref:Mitochondrial division protein 1 n=1 Tax=Orbilia blumenaviensis TaxID=1796055 RepID=A0AAV9VIG9_9PEZI
MSGAEFVAVAAVASSIIGIAEGINKVVQAASDAEGLPKVFRRAQTKLEIISDILDATTEAFKNKPPDTGVESTVQKTVANCRESWKKLEGLFEKVIPEEDSTRMERYRKAAKILGKGSKVETLLKDLMENVRLLGTLKIMAQGKEEVIQTNPRIEKLEGHIADVAKWEPSLPDSLFDDGGSYTMQIFGSGHNVAQGEHALQFISRDYAVNIGALHGGYHTSNVFLDKAARTDSLDKACLRFLQCPDTWAIKNSLLKAKDGLVLKAIQWFFEVRKYIIWRESNEISLFHIKGGAGKGKTMLAIGIIEQLESLSSNASANVAITYFFCQNGNYELNTPQGIIKGLILRLVNQREEAAQVLRERWDPKTECFTDCKGTPPWQMLWFMFLKMLDDCKCSRVYVIVDALDECQDVDSFLEHLVQTGLNRPSKIKWLLTSRPLDAAWRELPVGSDLVLEDYEPAVAGGVAAYVTEKTNKLNNQKHYGIELRREIENQLIRKAEGSYMWVSLVYEKLKEVDRHDALVTIQDSPLGLPSFYKKALNQLNSGDPVLVMKCTRLLKVIMLAYRPLTMVELGTFLALSDEPDAVNMLIDRCSSFIKRQGFPEVMVEFVHQSARDYLAGLDGQSILGPDERYRHGEIALSCIKSLLQHLEIDLGSLLRPDSTREPRNNSLVSGISYAATFWSQHLKVAEGTTLIEDALGEQGKVGLFLRTKFLEWLECLSLLDRLPYAMDALKILMNATNSERNPFISSFVEHALSFLQQHYQTIKKWPLQLYSSTIVFSPRTSMIRSGNIDKLPVWLRKIPQAEDAQEYPTMSFALPYGCINGIALSPDGKILAAVSDDNAIILWDTANGEHRGTIECDRYYEEVVTTILFSPDGKQIVYGMRGVIRLCDVTTGRSREVINEEFTRLNNRTIAITFSPDGRQIAFGFGNIVKVCFITGGLRTTFTGHSGEVRAVAFSPDGLQVASTSGSDIELWDAETGASSLQWRLRPGFTCHALTFLSDGRQLAVTGYGGIELWSPRTGIFQGKLKAYSDGTRFDMAAFSSDGKQIATGCRFERNNIKLWNIVTIGSGMEPGGCSTSVKSLTFSPDGKQIVSLSESALKLWDATTGNIHKVLADEEHVAPAFSSDSRQIASVCRKRGAIMLWDPITGDCQKEFQNGTGTIITALAFSLDGKQIALGFEDGIIILRDTKTGEVEKKLKGHPETVLAVLFSPDGKWIASGSADSTTKLWHARTGNLERTFKTGADLGPVHEIAFSPDSKQIASKYRVYIKHWSIGAKSSKIQRWIGTNDYDSSPIGSFLIFPRNIEGSIKFSEDGRYIVTSHGRINTEEIRAYGPGCENLRDLGVYDDWIYYEDMGILRLPLHIESTNIICEVRDDIVAIGLEDGRVLIFNFNRELLYSVPHNPAYIP